MRVSQLLGTTLRQVSTEQISEAEGVLLRAGYLRLLATGRPAYLHPGQKTMEKITHSFLDTISPMGGASIRLPMAMSPEFWQKLNLPAHLPYDSCAVLSHLAASEISSYRQLPGLFYQINDSGKTPVLEIWGLSANEVSHQEQYGKLEELIQQNLANLGLTVEKAKGNPGFSLASASKEWFAKSEAGHQNYWQNDFGLFRPESFSLPKPTSASVDPLPVEKVHTPDTSSIQDLANFLNIPASQTAKVVFYHANVVGKSEPQLVIAVIRGDMDVNETKVKNQIKALSLRAANDEEIKKVGCIPGFASPININRKNVIVIVDDLIPQLNNLVAGANEKDYHLINTCFDRDYKADVVADIADYKTDSQFANKESVKLIKGNPLASLINHHTYYSDLFQASFMGTGGRPEFIHLNYAQINLHEILLAAVSESADEGGLSWNEHIAPYQVSLVSLADGEETVEQAEKIYRELSDRGINVLYDDRHKKVAGPGVKFKDSDLQGIPLRITVSKRARKEGGVEVKVRKEVEKKIISVEAINTLFSA